MSTQTRYDQFMAAYETARDNGTSDDLKASWRDHGVYSASELVKQLQKLENKLSGKMLVYLFGEQLGGHLWEKFTVQCGRSLLRFFTLLTDEYRFFIIVELKQNRDLFFYE